MDIFSAPVFAPKWVNSNDAGSHNICTVPCDISTHLRDWDTNWSLRLAMGSTNASDVAPGAPANRSGRKSTARDWCFTSFNPRVVACFTDAGKNPDWSADTKSFFDAIDRKTRYCIGQVETCPESGRPHVQGFVRFRDPQRMGTVKAVLSDNAVHVEKRKASDAQKARDYCTKPNETFPDAPDPVSPPVEIGEWASKQGMEHPRYTIDLCNEELPCVIMPLDHYMSLYHQLEGLEESDDSYEDLPDSQTLLFNA